MKELIIHCPTKEDWDRVQEKAFNEGCKWVESGKTYPDDWEDNKEESCIELDSDGNMFYCYKKLFQEYFPEIPLITAKEYLNQKGEENKLKGSNNNL